MGQNHKIWSYRYSTTISVSISALRLALVFPLVAYWIYSSGHYELISRHAKLHDGTFDPNIAAGEKLAGFWSVFGLIWNSVAWLLSLRLSAPFNLPLAIVDTILAVFLSMSTHYQTGYAPHSKGQCSNARELQRPAGTNESFFEAAGRLNSTATTPGNMCGNFFIEYQYGISLAVIYPIIAVLNLIAFFGSVHHAKRQGASLYEQMTEVFICIWAFIWEIPRFLLLFCLLITYLLPMVFFRCLPFCIKSRVRYARQSALKTGLGLEQRSELQMVALKNKFLGSANDNIPYQNAGGTKSPLSEFLGIYDILILVAENLHYNDLMSLSRVSKSTRESVLPINDHHRRLRVYQLYTCPGAQKTPCWSCSNQICIECWSQSYVPLTPLYHHLENCIPYCSSCYRTHVSRVFGHLHTDHFCACVPVPQNPNIFQRILKGKPYYAANRLRVPHIVRNVCSDCSSLTGLELSEKKDKTTRTQVMKGRNREGEKWTRCAREGCGKELGMGPRWWVCGTTGCGKECGSLVHKGWGNGTKRKDEGIVGAEAV